MAAKMAKNAFSDFQVIITEYHPDIIKTSFNVSNCRFITLK